MLLLFSPGIVTSRKVQLLKSTWTSHHSAHARSSVWQIWLAESTGPEVTILGTDQKAHRLWGRECLGCVVPDFTVKISRNCFEEFNRDAKYSTTKTTQQKKPSLFHFAQITKYLRDKSTPRVVWHTCDILYNSAWFGFHEKILRHEEVSRVEH